MATSGDPGVVAQLPGYAIVAAAQTVLHSVSRSTTYITGKAGGDLLLSFTPMSSVPPGGILTLTSSVPLCQGAEYMLGVPDTFAPHITAYDPVQNSTNVQIHNDVVLTFNEPVQAGTGVLAGEGI